MIGYPDWWEEKHAKNSTAPPLARTVAHPGTAAAVVGADGGGYPHAATKGNKEVTQTWGGDRGAASIGAAEPVIHTGNANFDGGTVIRDWGEAEFG